MNRPATKRTPKKKHTTRHGEGVFYFRPSDQRWVGAFEAGDNAMGNRKRVTVSDRDEDEAWKKFQVRRKVLMLEGRAAAQQGSVTVKAWLTRWLVQEQKRVRPSTFRGTRTYVTRWMIPTLGRIQLEDLTADHCDNLVSAIAAEGLTTTYAGTVLGQFQSALKDAKKRGYRVPDAPLLVRKPAKSVHDRRDLEVEDAIKVVKHLGKMVDEDPTKAGFASRWLAAFIEGMRQGEALGMTWDRVMLDEIPHFKIAWQLQRLGYNIPYDKTSGFAVPDGHRSMQILDAWHFVELKTDSGYRLAPMLPVLMDMLKIWREHCPENEANLVWPRENGMPQNDKWDREEWRSIQRELGIWKTAPKIVDGEEVGGQFFTVHEIRHTTAGLLRHMRVDAKTIRDIMGHADEKTTELYQHQNLELAQQAIEALGQRLQLEGQAPVAEIIPVASSPATVDEMLGAFVTLEPNDRSIFLARAAVLLATT